MAEKKRMSITDVAKAMGISITTVSFILNGKAKERKISDALTKRVLDYVKKVGYRPSQLVRKARGRMKVLALLVEDIAHPCVREVGAHIEQIAATSGYQLIHCSTANDTQKMRQLIQFCMDKEVDGVIVTPSADSEELIGTLRRQHIPVILFDRFLPGIQDQISHVISDDRKGAYDATKHLLDTGGKRVGLVSLYSSQTHIRARLDGYMDAMDEFQRQSFIQKLNRENPEGMAEQIAGFLQDNKLDAVLFVDHDLAIGGLRGLKRLVMTWPRIVTFHNPILFELHTPAISVVAPDVAELARQLMETLTAEIEGRLKEAWHVVVPYTLIVRESFTVQPV